MTTALRVWMERIPEFSLRDGEPMEWAGGQVRGRGHALRVPRRHQALNRTPRVAQQGRDGG